MALGTSLPALLPYPTTRPVRYLDPVNGNDAWSGVNPSVGGTSGPWRTLQKGFDNLPADLRLLSGDYGTTSTIHTCNNKSGSASQPWVLRAHSGHTPNPRGLIKFTGSTSFGIIENIDFEGPSAGDLTDPVVTIRDTSNNLQFRSCEFHHSGAHNAVFYCNATGANANILVLNSIIHHGGNVAIGASTTFQGFYWPNGSGAIVNCIMHNNCDNGLQHYQNNDNDTLIVSHCLAFNNNCGYLFNSTGTGAGAKLINCIGVGHTGSRGNSIEKHTGQALEVRNGLFYNDSNGPYDVTNTTGYVNTGSQTGSTGATFTNATFVNYQSDGTGDYHLKSGSLAIGAGGNGQYVWPTDIEGTPRNEASIDLGPYTFSTGGGSGSSVVVSVPSATSIGDVILFVRMAGQATAASAAAAPVAPTAKVSVGVGAAAAGQAIAVDVITPRTQPWADVTVGA